jgi:hypothetical protein
MLTIRPAVLRDAKTMMEVHRQAVFAKAAGHYSRAILETWAPGATADRVVQVEHEIADPAFIVLVAEAAGDLIGLAMAIPTKGELRAVYVKPNPGEGQVKSIEPFRAPVIEFGSGRRPTCFVRAPYGGIT